MVTETGWRDISPGAERYMVLDIGFKRWNSCRVAFKCMMGVMMGLRRRSGRLAAPWAASGTPSTAFTILGNQVSLTLGIRRHAGSAEHVAISRIVLGHERQIIREHSTGPPSTCDSGDFCEPICIFNEIVQLIQVLSARRFSQRVGFHKSQSGPVYHPLLASCKR